MGSIYSVHCKLSQHHLAQAFNLYTWHALITSWAVTMIVVMIVIIIVVEIVLLIVKMIVLMIVAMIVKIIV